MKEMDKLYSGFFSILLLSMLVWGEARGEPEIGQKAVAWVVRNRVYATRNYGTGWRGVILKRKQFSAFNKEDVNRKKMGGIIFDSSTWQQFGDSVSIAFEVCFGFGEDPSKGATHYFRKGLSPIWSKKMVKTIEIGNHVFYKYKNE